MPCEDAHCTANGPRPYRYSSAPLRPRLAQLHRLPSNFRVIGYFRERERWKSRGFITKTIPEGMATPKKRGGAMPPLGGAPSSAVDLQAVSA